MTSDDQLLEAVKQAYSEAASSQADPQSGMLSTTIRMTGIWGLNSFQ
jgi:hypothetical protein